MKLTINTKTKLIGLLSTLAIASSIHANALAQTNTSLASATSENSKNDSEFAKFAPKAMTNDTKIDYAIWDDFLKYFVFPMGKSIREAAPRPDATLGSRRIYGHDSRYRLEGNRVVFSYIKNDIILALSEYRRDLEQVGNSIDIQTLSKNEQLAYWINLHNVAVIEQIAINYPVRQPSKLKVGPNKINLHNAKILNIRGVKMSPSDIRTNIIFPNWKDPKVIYGFFRGDIGGPSIQKKAFTANNTSDLLDRSATEFINSLRGAQKSGANMSISEIFTEARPHFFSNWPQDIKPHLVKYASPKVTPMITNAAEIHPRIYETDIADLANGQIEPSYNLVTSGGNPRGLRVPTSVARLLSEQNRKFKKIQKREGRKVLVTVGDIELPNQSKKIDEVQ